jgi:hypothetical protein
MVPTKPYKATIISFPVLPVFNHFRLLRRFISSQRKWAVRYYLLLKYLRFASAYDIFLYLKIQWTILEIKYAAPLAVNRMMNCDLGFCSKLERLCRIGGWIWVVHRDRVFPGLSGGQVINLSLQKHSGLALSAFVKSFFLINPLLGAMGLVLTRLSRSSNTLKEVHWGWSC